MLTFPLTVRIVDCFGNFALLFVVYFFFLSAFISFSLLLFWFDSRILLCSLHVNVWNWRGIKAQLRNYSLVFCIVYIHDTHERQIGCENERLLFKLKKKGGLVCLYGWRMYACMWRVNMVWILLPFLLLNRTMDKSIVPVVAIAYAFIVRPRKLQLPVHVPNLL